MPHTNKEIEELIEKALEKLHTQSRPNISKVAREFDVPYQRLRSRYQGKKSLFEREPNGRKLDPAQEKALCGWIDYNDSLGLPVKLKNGSNASYNDILNTISDIDFLAAISSIRTKTFTLRTIRLGFKLSGIWPINPNIVCDTLVDYNHPEVPESPSTNSSNSTNISTPKTIQRFQRLESRLLTLNKDISHYENIVKKLSKGAQSCAYQLEEAHREIETSKAATAARHARYANVAKMKRDKQKLTDLEAIDKLRPQWKKVMIELKRHCRQSGRRLKR
ncbi:hypothetical protein N7532_003402 [Penicillium argentinense]|uniref:HTH psq-type domain-containing protein n=1 Tax=Penicillium argentinense TaxID=1131581 RepID=A0A9W9FMI2_9EURO|nr:uncharacterized protein N7532_003402 [Penicillium argentinense]KAJ5102873.1 hypothetical protein N7532_003402 [Penicillium argentinense]